MPTVIEELVFAIGYKTDLAQLDKAAKAARKSADDQTQAFKDTQKAVEAAQDAVFNATDKASKKAAQVALRAAQKQAKAQRDVAREAEKSAREAEAAYKNAAKAAEDSAKKTRDAWAGAGKAIAVGFAGIATAVGAGVAKITHDVIENGLELDVWRTKLDATAIELQRVELAGKAVRVPVDNTREAVKTLRENLGELERIGTGPARDSLGSLGLKLEDLINLPLEDQLGVLADALADVDDHSKRLSIAIELMGEDGAALLPLLSKGSGGIRELGNQAEATGAIMSDEMVDKTVELNGKLEGMKNRASGVALELVDALMPAMEEIAEDTEQWADENQELIDQELPELLREIAAAARLVVEAVGAVGGAFLDAKKAASDFMIELADLSIRSDITAAERRGEISSEAAAASRRVVGTSGIGGVANDSPQRRAALARAEAQREAERRRQEQGQIAAQSAAAQAAADTLQYAIPAAEARRKRREKFERDERNKTGGGGGGKSAKDRAAEKELAEALAQVRLLGIEDELRSLGVSAGASDKAIEAAIKASADSVAKGASKVVAKKAGVGQLSSLTGVDLAAKQTDPLLSAIFGDDTLPDVPLSELERGQEPQVLISTVNNNYNVDVTNEINGAGSPAEVAEEVETRFRTLMGEELSEVSKYSKVKFAR